MKNYKFYITILVFFKNYLVEYIYVIGMFRWIWYYLRSFVTDNETS